MNPYVGEIRLVPFNFEPEGWAFCDGSLLSISEFEVLFILIGTTYGGDGQQTFALPDLRGRVPIHMAGNFPIGMVGGSENAVIDSTSLPAHRHQLQVNSSVGAFTTPASHMPASAPSSIGNSYSGEPDVLMSSNSLGSTGSGQPHQNMQPYLAMNYVISLFGIFPSQN